MIQGFTMDGTKARGTAGEAHHQLGEVERHGKILEWLVKKIIKQVVPTTEDEYRECVANALDAKNRMYRRHGWSPYQHSFGRDPPLPGDLLCAVPDVIVSS